MIVKNIGSALAITLPTLTGDTKSRFAVLGSGTEIPVVTLGVGESKTISFVLAADDNVEVGVYNFPVALSFYNQSIASGIGIKVISKALLTLPKVQTDPVTILPDKSFLCPRRSRTPGRARLRA